LGASAQVNGWPHPTKPFMIKPKLSDVEPMPAPRRMVRFGSGAAAWSAPLVTPRLRGGLNLLHDRRFGSICRISGKILPNSDHRCQRSRTSPTMRASPAATQPSGHHRADQAATPDPNPHGL